MINKIAELSNEAASLIRMGNNKEALAFLEKAQLDIESLKRSSRNAYLLMSYDIDEGEIATPLEIIHNSATRDSQLEIPGECDEGMRTFSEPLQTIIHVVGDIDCYPMDQTIVDAVVNYNLGVVLTRLDDDHKAYAYFQDSLSLIQTYSSVVEKEAKKFDFLVTATLHNLGHINYRHGKYTEALLNYRSAHQKTPEEDYRYGSSCATIDEALSLNCIGVVTMHMSQGSDKKNEQALNYLCEALKVVNADNENDYETFHRFIREKITATIMNNIGRIQVLLGGIEDALARYNQVFKIRRRILGEDHIDTVAMYFNVAEALLISGGQTKRALDMLNMYVCLSSNLLDHDLIGVFTLFAEAYIELRNLPKAANFYQKALKKMKAAPTPDQVQIAVTSNSLGHLLCEIGEHDAALKIYKEGLDLELELYDTNDSRTIITILNIARIYRHKNFLHRALEQYQEALRMQRHAKDINRLDLASTLEDIGLVNSRLGKLKTSINAYLEALAIKMKELGKHHHDVSSLMNSIGLAYLKKARHDDALYYFEKSLSIRSQGRLLDSRSVSSVEVMMNMATTHLEKSNDNKALELFETCLQILESSESDQDQEATSHREMISSLYEGMLRVYEKMDCPMNASYIRQEAKKLRRASMSMSVKEAKRKSHRGVSSTGYGSSSSSSKSSRSHFHGEEKRGSMSMGIKEAKRKSHRSTSSSTCSTSSSSINPPRHCGTRSMPVYHEIRKPRRATMSDSSVCATVSPTYRRSSAC